MEIRNLGQSGLRVSSKALDLGITLFDTADTYGERGGSETVMGKILGDDRKRIVLATKFGMPMDDVGVKVGGSRRYIMQAVEDSLRRLRTDWFDLYQIHQPDPRTPIEETLRALDDLVHQGKVRYIGCSNFPAWQMVEAQWTAKANNLNAFVSCQAEQHGHTLLELAFSWLLAQAPVTSVIAGATRPEQLEQNVKAGGWKLSMDELAAIDRITAG